MPFKNNFKNTLVIILTKPETQQRTLNYIEDKKKELYIVFLKIKKLKIFPEKVSTS